MDFLGIGNLTTEGQIEAMEVVLLHEARFAVK
jgi:hypothetical protein